MSLVYPPGQCLMYVSIVDYTNHEFTLTVWTNQEGHTLLHVHIHNSTVVQDLWQHKQISALKVGLLAWICFICSVWLSVDYCLLTIVLSLWLPCI